MSERMQGGSPAGEYQRRDRVAEALGRRLGLLASSARQVLVGSLNHRVVQVIASFDDVREFERRERWVAPIRAALQSLAWEPYSKDLLRAAQVADSAEEVAQTDFQNDPCPVNRDRYIAALQEQQITTLALQMALINERRAQAA